MKRLVNLGTLDWAAAGVRNVPLEPIPDEYGDDNYYVAGIVMDCRFDITTGAGGGCTCREIMEWISNIFLRATGHVFCNGINAYQLQVLVNGIFERHGDVSRGGCAAIAASQTNDISHFPVWIDFEQMHAFDGIDSVVLAAMFNDAVLQVQLGQGALNANTTINAMQIRVWASLDRMGELRVPGLLPTVQAYDGVRFERLPAGIYTTLMAGAPADPWAAADITMVSLRAAGEHIHSAVEPDALLQEFFRQCELGTFGTMPLGGYDWKDQAALCDYLPLIWPQYTDAANRARLAVDSKGSLLHVDMGGAAAAVAYIMKYWTPITPTTSKNVFAKTGVANVDDLLLRRKTFSKSAITAGEIAQAPGLSRLPIKVVGIKSGNRLSLGRQTNKVMKIAQTSGRLSGVRR